MRLWYQFDHSRDIVFPKSITHATHPSPWSTDDTPSAFYAEGENSLVTTKIISFSESVVLQKQKNKSISTLKGCHVSLVKGACNSDHAAICGVQSSHMLL